MAPLRPHDLLWLGEGALVGGGLLPAWATSQWLQAAPWVMRRAAGGDGLVAVGLRGLRRSERFAGWARVGAVQRVLTPEAVLQVWRGQATWPELPALRMLQSVRPALDASSLCWGVTGGAGFMLASGLPVLRADSDLDLLIRAPKADDADALRNLALRLPLPADGESRIDIQVQAAAGGFSLREWQRSGGPVLMKTVHGPKLVDDPWGT